MPIVPDLSISELAYQVIQHPLRELVLTTKVRNEVIAYTMEHRPLWLGEMYSIKSENLGGGIWRMYAEKYEGKSND